MTYKSHSDGQEPATAYGQVQVLHPAARWDAWDQATAAALEAAYVAGGSGPRGSGVSADSEGEWRAKRQHLAAPMDGDGSWLDIGCANGHLLSTLPAWAAERGVNIEPFGLELIPAVADLARSAQPDLADRIWTGSVMSWRPPRSFRYVTALEDAVPPEDLGDLVARLLTLFVEPEGRLILSSYTNAEAQPRPLVDDLIDLGITPGGVINIDRPDRHPLQTVWIDA